MSQTDGSRIPDSRASDLPWETTSPSHGPSDPYPNRPLSDAASPEPGRGPDQAPEAEHGAKPRAGGEEPGAEEAPREGGAGRDTPERVLISSHKTHREQSQTARLARISARANGISMAVPGFGHPIGTDVVRGDIVGWSKGAARRNVEFLQSVAIHRLDGAGEAVTLTMRDLPPSHADWHHLLDRLLKRIRRMGGVIRDHWVTEFQGRKVPHLHLAVYGQTALGWLVVSAWLDVAEPYGVERSAQYVTPITGPLGWLQYLAKHAARGVAHYQRQGMPPGWTKTGRLWGHGGSWPLEEAHVFDVSMETYWIIRRANHRRVVADARANLLQARAELADAQTERLGCLCRGRYGTCRRIPCVRERRLTAAEKAASKRLRHVRKALSWATAPRAGQAPDEVIQTRRKASMLRGMTEWTSSPEVGALLLAYACDLPGEVVDVRTGEGYGAVGHQAVAQVPPDVWGDLELIVGVESDASSDTARRVSAEFRGELPVGGSSGVAIPARRVPLALGWGDLPRCCAARPAALCRHHRADF